jgi:glutathione S-transferase
VNARTKGPELIGLTYSPWTEKARWALDYCQKPYHYTEHLIFFGMPILHWKCRQFRRSLTVPVLLTQTQNFYDSLDIARYADENSQAKQSLFPAQELEQVLLWNRRSEQALDAGRSFMLVQLSGNQEALLEAVPGFLKKMLGPLAIFAARFGAWYIQRSFQSDRRTPNEAEELVREQLMELRTRLSGRGYKTILPSFSYADVAMATVVQFLEPVANEYISIGPETRRVWRMEKLAKEFPDLIEWRDRIYSEYRASKMSE